MILKKYNQIMDKIQVTPQMRERILTNIEKEHFSYKRKKYFLHHTLYRIIFPFAACLLIAFTIITAFENPTRQKPAAKIPDENNDELITNFGITETDSAKKLSAMAGFSVNDISYLADTAEKTYYYYGNNLAEIQYEFSEQNISYRKSQGNGDNSGDYNKYNSIEKIQINSYFVTIKGNDNNYSLAIWNNGKYSYSINLENAIAKKQFINLLKKCIE